MSTATETKPAETKPAAKTDAPKELNGKQLKEARALREGDPAKGIDGLTFVEIATKMGVTSSLVSKALAGLPAGRAKAKGTVTPHERKASTTLDWDGAIKSVAKVAGSTIAWYRATYCMVRADNGRSGVSAGSVIAGTKTPWATVCEHLTVHGASKGGTAEEAGKNRAEWCAKCKEGKPGVVPKKAGAPEAKKAAPKADAKKEAKAQDEKALLLAAAREGGAAAVKEVKAAPKAQPRPSRAGRNAEKAAEALARREAAAAARAEGEAAEAAAVAASTDDLDTIA